MGIDTSGITPEEETAFLTLKARAINDGWTRPLLPNPGAVEVVNQIDYDFDALGIPTPVVCQASLRAKLIDDRVHLFVLENPDAIVVDLGAGLDDGYRRIKPSEGIDWYSVDLPGMAELRNKALPPGAREHTVGTSITDPAWISAIPSDRRAIVLADGFFPFLTEQQIKDVMRAITEHFPSGQLVFNDYGRNVAGVWVSKLLPQKMFKKVNDMRKYMGYNDPHTPERWNPALRLVENTSIGWVPEVELFPTWLRIATRIAGLWDTTARTARILRFEF